MSVNLYYFWYRIVCVNDELLQIELEKLRRTEACIVYVCNSIFILGLCLLTGSGQVKIWPKLTVFDKLDNSQFPLCFKGIGTPVEKIIQSVDLFFPVQLIVSLIVYQHVNYFFDIPLTIHAARWHLAAKNVCDVTGSVEFVVMVP